MIEYQYIISLEPDLISLESDINNSSNIFSNVNYSTWYEEGERLHIYFDNSLSSSEKTELDNIVGQL